MAVVAELVALRRDPSVQHDHTLTCCNCGLLFTTTGFATEGNDTESHCTDMLQLFAL